MIEMKWHRMLMLVLVCLTSAAWGEGPAEPTSDSAPAWAAVRDCESLQREDFTTLPEAPTSILKAQRVAGGEKTPEYCAVTGYVAPQIQFELRLPLTGWNGRYLQTGCGGYCGVVNVQSCGDALDQSFAVGAQNMGHVGDPLRDPLWGGNPQLREDFGMRSTHVVAVAAKAVITRYYGKAPRFAYLRGCSTGGREGLSEAQHYPDDFDGIIAGDPAFAGRLGGIANNWDARQLLAADGTPVFSRQKLELLHNAVLRACDARDGLVDGIIADPRNCKFDPASLVCRSGAHSSSCLTEAEVAAAKRLYDGPRNSRGERLFPGYVVAGSELAWNGEFVRALSDGFVKYLSGQPTRTAAMGYRQIDFDRDMMMLEASARLYDPVAPHEAPDLRAFAARGGKLILYHGWADAGASPLMTLDYYAQVEHRAASGEPLRNWFRLFMVPGMFHCRGGDAPNTFDWLGPVVDWVEHGRAPDRIVGSQVENGRIVRSRPVFPYPLEARYTGKGDANTAANWLPVKPRVQHDDRISWVWQPR